MTTLRGDELSSGGEAAQGRFRGRATIRALHTSADPHPVRVAVVSFEPGTVNFWHSHAGGQVLHVLSGQGRHQRDGEAEESLRAGDTATVEPGRRHWHGAAREHAMAHLAISIGETAWTDDAPPE
jgi:quercetin dioxygenase-like cupin family protein